MCCCHVFASDSWPVSSLPGQDAKPVCALWERLIWSGFHTDHRPPSGGGSAAVLLLPPVWKPPTAVFHFHDMQQRLLAKCRDLPARRRRYVLIVLRVCCCPVTRSTCVLLSHPPESKSLTVLFCSLPPSHHPPTWLEGAGREAAALCVRRPAAVDHHFDSRATEFDPAPWRHAETREKEEPMRSLATSSSGDLVSEVFLLVEFLS